MCHQLFVLLVIRLTERCRSLLLRCVERVSITLHTTRLGKDLILKFEVQFSLNSYLFSIIVKYENKWNHSKLGTVCTSHHKPFRGLKSVSVSGSTYCPWPLPPHEATPKPAMENGTPNIISHLSHHVRRPMHYESIVCLSPRKMINRAALPTYWHNSLKIFVPICYAASL